MIDANLKSQFAQAFASSLIKPADICTCDSCGALVFRDDVHIHSGSMGKEFICCPECDLPEKWSMRFSKSRLKRYYVFFDPLNPKTSYVQWGHPNEGNPLHNSLDKGQIQSMKKRKK